MVTLDPIVVNEKKELPVPDFNKKEVEGIAVDAVKAEIAAGNIPTGTKLYLHDIRVAKNNDGEVFHLKIINTTFTQFSNSDSQGFNNNIFCSGDYKANPSATGYNAWVGDLQYAGGFYNVGLIIIDSGLIIKSIGSYSSTITDTVTEL